MHDLVLGRSIGLTMLAGLLHLGGWCGALWVLPPWLWPFATALLGAALWQALRRKPGDVTRAQGSLAGEWTLTRRAGQREPGWRVDVARSFCHPWLVILALRHGRRSLYLPLAADVVNADALRRLRVSLRAAG